MSIDNMNKVISKYYSNEKRNLDSCFENERYKYLNLDGSYNVVEVPLDHFNLISYDMKEMVKEGKIYGVFNPLLINQMFKSSMFTYNQVKNIALMGWIDGIKINENQDLVFETDIGLSPLIACALKKLDKDFFISSDLKIVYEKVDEFFKEEKITKGLFFKKEVELIDDLKEVDIKCMQALKEISYQYLLTSSEIQDIAHDLKSNKYVEFLKKIIDNPDVYQSAYEKIEDMAKDALEDRKIFKLKTLYKEALKSLKLENNKAYNKEIKEVIKKDALLLNFAKMIIAIFILSVGIACFFQANLFESKLKFVDDYTTNVLSQNNSKFDTLFKVSNEKVSSKIVLNIFEKVSNTVILSKTSFSLLQFILDFGKNWFFMPLLPLLFVFLSLYFALGMKNNLSRKFYGIARILFIFAFLLRFFVPLNSYVLAKTDEYALNTVYEKSFISFKSYVENDKKTDKKSKQQVDNLEKDLFNNSGNILAILYLKLLILPLLVLLTFKRFLSFK